MKSGHPLYHSLSLHATVLQQLWQPYVDIREQPHRMSLLEFTLHDTWWTLANTRKRIRKQQAVGSNPTAGSTIIPLFRLYSLFMRILTLSITFAMTAGTARICNAIVTTT